MVSGGAFGIDGWAHRGALSAEGITIAVLPSGLDDPYPRGHHELFQAIVAHGVLVSERPPGRAPTRPGFLVRNRLIAVSAGVDFDTVMRCLGQLAAGGYVERCERGWRLRSPG